MQDLSKFIKDKLQKLQKEKETATETNDSIYLTYLYGRIDSYLEFLNNAGKDDHEK